jgi:predicted transcriptional regulator YdeE
MGGNRGGPVMEPTIVEKEQMMLVGFSFFGDPFAESGGWTEGNEIGRLWDRFGTYMANNANRIKYVVDNEVGYEIHIYHDETASKGHYEVFVGIEVGQLEDVPVETLVKVLPPARYAVFNLRGQQITSDWHLLIEEWMSKEGYQQAHNYGFQYYDSRFKGLERIDESEIDVYVPIKK